MAMLQGNRRERGLQGYAHAYDDGRWCASWDSNPQHLDFKSNPTTDCGRGADALGGSTQRDYVKLMA